MLYNSYAVLTTVLYKCCTNAFSVFFISYGRFASITLEHGTIALEHSTPKQNV